MDETEFEERWHEFARFECPDGHILQKTVGDRQRIQCGSCATTYTRDDLIDRKCSEPGKVGQYSTDPNEP